MIQANLLQSVCILTFMIVNIIVAALIVINHIRNCKNDDSKQKHI